MEQISLGGLSVSRFVVGGNPISGFAHADNARRQAMLDYFTVERTKVFFRRCEEAGITALVARADPFIMRLLREYWNEGGRITWIAQTAPEHRDPRKLISRAVRAGASAVFVHGGEVGRLHDAGRFEEVGSLVAHIRSHGVPAGIAAHRPELLLAAQSSGFGCDFYNVCLYRVDGHRGNPDIAPGEHFLHADRAPALATVAKLNRPCLVYKIFAAGRRHPREAFQDVVPALRPGDGVLAGLFPPDAENIYAETLGAFHDALSR